MWRNWLSRSPKPSQRNDDEKYRFATLPREQQRHRDDSESSSQFSSANPPQEKKGLFNFLRSKRWRTLSRSRHTSPKHDVCMSAENAATRRSSGSCTPTNEGWDHMTLPLCLPDSISVRLDETEVTPKSEDANKSMRTSLHSSRTGQTGEKSQCSPEVRRLSRKDSNNEEASLLHLVTGTPERTEDQTAEINQSFLRAARSGNIGKIVEHLNSNVDINAVSSNGLNALHLASKEGHLATVRLFLDHHAAIDAKTNRGNTALHIASLAGRGEIIRLLVERGADINARSQNGFTPLYMAAQENYVDIVEYLLNNGADQTLATDDGFTPLAVALQLGHDAVVALLLERDSGGRGRLPALHVAAKKDDVHAVALLLSNNDLNVNHASTRGFTPLHIAARYGNVKVARLLLSHGANVNCCSKDSITPLHLAAKWSKAEMTQLLIDKGAQLDARTQDGLTPMHTAARSGHTNVVQVLLNAGSSITAKTRNGLSPLHMAAQSDHADTAKLLLKKGSPPDDVTMDYLTPLHIAAHCGNTKVAQVLLDHRCDPNLRAFNGFTPLHVACKKMKTKIVELLLKKGATVDATTQAGLTPLHAAAFVGCTEAAALLLQRGANANQVTMRGETPLHFAVRGRHFDTAKLLLRHSDSVNAKAKEQATPLHIALRLRDSGLVKLLLQAGADVQSEARGKHQPIHLASKVGEVDIMRFLLENGAQVDAQTKRLYTALHIATKYGKTDAMNYLLGEAKANVNSRARNGLTPLHVAIIYDCPQAVEILLSHGADVNSKCKNGFTPLHLAAKMKTPEIATLLLKANAPPDSVSQNGYSALHLASLEGDLKIVQTLIDEYGAQVNLAAKDGLTPLHLAVHMGRMDVAQVLLARGAEQTMKTKKGYTALSEAAYRGNVPLVKLLLAQSGKEEVINSTTIIGFTPLHLAAQQGHSQVVDLLLNSGADPNSKTKQGWTAAQLAKKRNYPNIFESLSRVTTSASDWDSSSLEGANINGDLDLNDGSMLLDSPAEILDRVALVESDDESDRLVSTPVVMRRHSRSPRKASVGELSLFKSSSYNLLCEQMEYTRVHKGEPKIRISALDSTMDEQTRVSELTGISTFSMRKSDIEMSAVTPLGSDDWATLATEPIQAICKPVKSGFLVSFLVDARGGFVEANRRPDLRFLIPPLAVSSPTRIICRFLRPDRVSKLPHLNDGDAFACRIIEMSPSCLRFDGPIVLEVPHFASIQGCDREVITLRCDHGDSWKAHPLEATDQSVQGALRNAFGEIEPSDTIRERRIQRILTADMPRFFALISRFRQEIALIGPDGGVLASTVAPKVQAVFPKGALQKRIKVGLQAQVIQPQIVKKMAGNRAAFSAVVTLEPRRRKFHKPITVTIPLPRQPPKGAHKSDLLPSSLHLLCSITADSSPAKWEDITGSTTMTRHKDCILFTTTVSARLWLVDVQEIEDVAEMASRVYQESIIPPYIGKFAVYARSPEDRQAIEANEAALGASSVNGILGTTSATSRFRRKVFHPDDAELRCVCLIDDSPAKTLEQQEKFQLIGIGTPTEVMNSKTYWIETVGDISSYPAHAGQLCLEVQAFQENRLTYPVRVRQSTDTTIPPVGRFSVYQEPTAHEQSVTTLEIHLPCGAVKDQFHEASAKVEPAFNIKEIAKRTGARWPQLAKELDFSPEDIETVAKEPQVGDRTGPEADVERCELMLELWTQHSEAAPERSAIIITEALQKTGISLDGAIVVPEVLRVHHIDEELSSSREPSAGYAIQLKSPTATKPISPPWTVADDVITSVEADTSSLTEDGHLPVKDETPPPTAMDGTPRLVPGEEVPYIIPSSIKSATLDQSMAMPVPAIKDDLSALDSEIKPSVDEFIVASENLKRKRLLVSDGTISHADSVTRQKAAEELADALGLDVDAQTISIISQPSSDNEEVLFLEPIIESIKCESRQKSNARVSPRDAETAAVKPSDALHVEAALDYELRVPSTERLDITDEDFEEAYRVAAAEGTPSPTGLVGHDVHQGRPEEGFLMEETEEVLSDGTIVNQRIQTAETIQCLSAHDWEEAVLKASAITNDDQYIIETPEEVVKVEEVEETLPDGTVIKKRITTQHITERITEREVTEEVSENEVRSDEAAGGVVEY